MIIVIITIILIIITIMYALKNLPVEIVNFDLEPKERWVELINKYKPHILGACNILEDRMEQVMGKYGKYAFDTMVQSVISLYGKNHYYYEELKSIADVLEIPLHRVVLIQYGYECFSSCTSAVVKYDDETVHLRTMDWNDNSLRPLTIQLKIMQKGEIVADTTTWAGFVGFMTIVKPNICSISINHRLHEHMAPHRNLWGILFGRMTISYLVREAVLNNDNYDDIVKMLKTTPLSAPCYITIGCNNFSESMILVRDRNDCHTHMMDDNVGYLVQTNIDPNDNRESMNRNKSIERRSVFKNQIYPCLNDIESSDYKKMLMTLFLQYPIIKFNTIYVCVMQPSNIDCLNYTKYVSPDSRLELMISGKLLDFWNQIPPHIYDQVFDNE